MRATSRTPNPLAQTLLAPLTIQAMPDKQPSLMRSLGLVTGDLWSLVSGKKRTPPSPPSPPPVVVRKDVQTKTLDTPHGPVTLKRTTIDEVEFRDPPKAE